MSEVLAISSEDDAVKWIEAYLQGNIDPKDGQVQLDGWPKITIRLTGPKFEQSLTPSVMKGFVELQTAIYRAAALEKAGVPNANKLSKDEREALEFKVEVKKGSSILQIDLQALLTQFIDKAVPTMDPITISATVLGLGLVWASQSVARAHLQNRKEIREQEVKAESEREHLRTLQFVSEEDTKKMEIIKDLATKLSGVDNAARFSEDAKNVMLKRFSTADTVEIDGVELDGELAADLVKHARRTAEQVRLDGRYRIERNDTTDPTAFKVRIRNVENNRTFEALVQDDSVNNAIKSAIQKAEWDRTVVHLRINAKALDDEIKNAVIIGIDVPNSPKNS